MCVRCDMGTWRKGDGRDGCCERDAGRAKIFEEGIPLALPILYLVVSGGEPKPHSEALFSPRVWYTQLEAICSMWPQPSSTCLTSMQRMCSGAQQTLAGSLAILMSPTDQWPTVPPVFW